MHSFDNYFLSTYSVPALAVGTEKTAVNKTDLASDFKELTLWGRRNAYLTIKPVTIMYNISVVETIKQGQWRESDRRGSILDMLLKQVSLRR